LSKNKGDFYEDKACEYLKENGFVIVERNFYAKKLGEIDIITLKDDIYHFVEVKSGDDFEAIYNITPQKLSKLKRSVSYYIQKNKIEKAYCIDAIIYQNDRLEYIENITL
jgi:putative endonuclease